MTFSPRTAIFFTSLMLALVLAAGFKPAAAAQPYYQNKTLTFGGRHLGWRSFRTSNAASIPAT